MNPLEALRDRIFERFPSVWSSIEGPLNPTGYWHLDLRLGDKEVPIQWKENAGFGFCACENPDDHGYGERPDVIHQDIDVAFEQCVKLLTQE